LELELRLSLRLVPDLLRVQALELLLLPVPELLQVRELEQPLPQNLD
jgi:hypothetical protein